MGPEQHEQAFRRIAFNVMATHRDDHTKNVSFVLRDRSIWVLAPAYDLVYAYNPKGEWRYQHLMSVNGQLSLADRFQIGSATKVLAQVNGAVAAWPDFARQAKVSPHMEKMIRSHQVLM